MIKSSFDYLDLSDFKIIVEQLRSQNEAYSLDIPPFNFRYPEKLEAIIDQVQAVYFGQEIYPDFLTKAAMLFYLINKDHPFGNGNKRVSVVALYEFIHRNVSELYIDEEALTNDLYEMAIYTASSLPEQFDDVLIYLNEKVASFIISY